MEAFQNFSMRTRKNSLSRFGKKEKDLNNSHLIFLSQKKETVDIATGIASGMSYLHSKKTMHRDLKRYNNFWEGK